MLYDKLLEDEDRILLLKSKKEGAQMKASDRKKELGLDSESEKESASELSDDSDLINESLSD